ncbi:MAG: hypothetical protein ACP5JN_04175 [Candidatus Micrarchaeia archaeon]
MKRIEFRIFVPDQRAKDRISSRLAGYGDIHTTTKPTFMVYGEGPKIWLMKRLAEIAKKEGDAIKIEWREHDRQRKG